MSIGARNYRAGRRHKTTPGTVYLVCFRTPDGSKGWVGHAGHYVGWSKYLSRRKVTHEAGRGARLTAVAVSMGLVLELVRTMPGTLDDEYRVKCLGGMTRYCPRCSSSPGTWAFPRARA
jgi:hypothetical protein